MRKILELTGLLLKNIFGQSDKNEDQLLNDWLDADKENRLWFDRLKDRNYINESLREINSYDSVDAFRKVQLMHQRKKQVRLFQRMGYAAGILLLIGMGLWYSYQLFLPEPPENAWDGIGTAFSEGRPKARLILPEGEVIVLDRDLPGLSDRNFETDGQKLRYSASGQQEVQMHTLQVPRGGEYEVMLADGTQVWLNAESELVYPDVFKGEERRVFLKGEAYFKVVNNDKPFIVEMSPMEVRVLGTEFNLNAYPEQSTVSATLINGVIEVSVPEQETMVLEPEHQFRFNHQTNETEYLKINPLPYTAWKEGKFVFFHEELESIVKRLERWYDVKMVFADEELKEIKIFGIVNRYQNIEEVLKVILSTKAVNFRYEDGVIEIVRYNNK